MLTVQYAQAYAEEGFNIFAISPGVSTFLLFTFAHCFSSWAVWAYSIDVVTDNPLFLE